MSEPPPQLGDNDDPARQGRSPVSSGLGSPMPSAAARGGDEWMIQTAPTPTSPLSDDASDATAHDDPSHPAPGDANAIPVTVTTLSASSSSSSARLARDASVDSTSGSQFASPATSPTSQPDASPTDAHHQQHHHHSARSAALADVLVVPPQSQSRSAAASTATAASILRSKPASPRQTTPLLTAASAIVDAVVSAFSLSSSSSINSSTTPEVNPLLRATGSPRVIGSASPVQSPSSNAAATPRSVSVFASPVLSPASVGKDDDTSVPTPPIEATWICDRYQNHPLTDICQRCDYSEEAHAICGHFIDSGGLVAGSCAVCGRHEFDHRACTSYEAETERQRSALKASLPSLQERHQQDVLQKQQEFRAVSNARKSFARQNAASPTSQTDESGRLYRVNSEGSDIDDYPREASSNPDSTSQPSQSQILSASNLGTERGSSAHVHHKEQAKEASDEDDDERDDKDEENEDDEEEAEDEDEESLESDDASSRSSSSSGSEDDGAERVCAHCGRHEEDHQDACDHFDPQIDGLAQNSSSAFLNFLRQKPSMRSSTAAAVFLPALVVCSNCRRPEIDHELCEFFEDAQALPGFCDNCGRQESDHDLCGRYTIHESDTNRCDTCGRLKEDHEACDRYSPDANGQCANCGKAFHDHAWAHYMRKELSQPKYRYGSFADVHTATRTKWLVDGHDIFEALYHSLTQARKEIFITGWFTTPEIFLKRTKAQEALPSRLDRVLLSRASAGVKIYMLLWNETKLAFRLNSSNAKKILESLHPNIKVITHPGPTGPLNWSHHEKTTIIDQKVAFVGGLDYAFGRYDTPAHSITDPCHMFMTWPGKDYYNPSIVSIDNVHRPFDDAIDRMTQPRMAWHDICVRIEGGAARDVAVSFIQRWNHHKENMDCGPDYICLLPRSTNYYSTEKSNVDSSNQTARVSSSAQRQDDAASKASRTTPLKPLDLAAASKLPIVAPQHSLNSPQSNEAKWPSSSSGGAVPQAATILETASGMVVDRQGSISPTPIRSASSDALLTQVPTSARASLSPSSAAPRLPRHSVGSSTPISAPVAPVTLSESASLLKTHLSNSSSASNHPTAASPDYCWTECQILRSISHWSGSLVTEDSIQQAYLVHIANAQHYIYMENQYFVSSAGTAPKEGTRNMIANAIVTRISKAIREKETFRVIVVLPVTPEGSFVDEVTVRYTMYLQYKTIYRGSQSMLGQLAAEFPDVDLSRYIGFFALRQHGVLEGRRVTEQIYMHAKTMIVDDVVTIVGSANINDRSLLGDRDSEMCLITRDLYFVDGTMNGKPHRAGLHAYSLRCRLWREHLGLADADLRILDPVADSTYVDLWLRTAHTNTALFERLFPYIPSDKIPTLKALEAINAKYNASAAAAASTALVSAFTSTPPNTTSTAVSSESGWSHSFSWHHTRVATTHLSNMVSLAIHGSATQPIAPSNVASAPMSSTSVLSALANHPSSPHSSSANRSAPTLARAPTVPSSPLLMAISAAADELGALSDDDVARQITGHLVLYPMRFLHESLNLSLLDWGANIVVQDVVFQ
ncbi:phospholipase D zeta2 [Capsaspora owczarzaki ATCC 30864]|uniref:phospholipase D n=1 Tax=Capsaspora owczarzaki (strain ATCC 30864) TaxID=595528 RepID=A0A0D2UBQ3_CAPO3|nr:phospholipase D zeta2 [Capsaspora owczarzaki ATCC 30864]KJE92461.1 phospholipase D zeta2, variant [Capsaspora owczarzaki ATCC 30864]|eukprot:XP_004364271.1 phospholipase D zeta2 [Capsaspora owczarzaki ATCC 30864]